MEDERWEPGVPVLDRQPIGAPLPEAAGTAQAATPAAGGASIGASAVAPATASPASSARPVPPRSVPETRPTPLQKHYALLSAPALVAGAIAITAVEFGASPGSLPVKVCVLVAAPLLAIANGDALVRIWRSAWAWMPVDHGRGLFRLAWVVAGLGLYVLLLVIALGVLLA